MNALGFRAPQSNCTGVTLADLELKGVWVMQGRNPSDR
jgi:hypothetical protein